MISIDKIKQWEQERNIKKLIKSFNLVGWEFRNEIADALIRIGEPVIQPLIDAHSKVFDTWCHEAPVILEKIYKSLKDDKIFNIIIDCLNKNDKGKGWLRMTAAEALGRIKDKRAEEPLIDIIVRKGAHINSEVVTALAKLKSDKAVLPLIHNMVYQDEYIDDTVIAALVKIGGSAVDPLLETLNHHLPKQQEAAVIALKKLKKKNIMNAEQVRRFDLFVQKNKPDIHRGGFGEPYCSEKCFKDAAIHINQISLAKPRAVCGFCNSKLDSAYYYKKCCMCQRKL
jgi:HEAT repeat protein